jgi:hypothetical protein
MFAPAITIMRSHHHLARIGRPRSLTRALGDSQTTWITPMHEVRLLLGAVLLAVSCRAGHPMPLEDLATVTRIQVQTVETPAETRRLLTDPAQVATVRRTLLGYGSRWETSWHTLPMGQEVAAFYRDTVHLGTVWVGPTFLVARGRAGQGRILSLEPTELVPLRVALGLPPR